jgi:histidine triad (HIT) family protein
MFDSSCIFCRIASREVPTEILRETDLVVAFRDMAPQAPTHVLLVPKDHLASVAEIGPEHGALMVDLVQSAAHLARTEGIDESGWRLITNVGPDSGQAVFHLHFHLLGGRPLGRLVGSMA